MERALTQQEIETMLHTVRGHEDTKQNESRSIKPCTFRQSGQLTGEQVAAINGLHEAFARNVTQSLGAYLRVAFEVNLVKVEQLAYSEFLARIPEVTYMMCVRVEEMSASAAMQVDHSVVFPLVDILLGGTGACEVPTREVSEIEEQIMDGVSRIICSELDAAWAPLGTKLHLDGRQAPAQMPRFLPSTEKTLCLSFEIKMAEVTGIMNLVFPVSISNTLLRKLSADASHGRVRAKDRSRAQMTAKMLDCPFSLQLGINSIQLPIDTLVRLVPQAIYNLGIPVRKPASLIVAGRELFDANPVRHGRQRAAHLGQSTLPVNEERK